MKCVQINEYDVWADEFAYDGCHKIYLLESEEDKVEAIEIGYQIYPVEDLDFIYRKSCPLKYIDTWKLESIIPQCFEERVEIRIMEG